MFAPSAPESKAGFTVERFQGLVGIVLILGVIVLLSRRRSAIRWRTLVVGLVLQAAVALLILKWEPGYRALKWFAGLVQQLIAFTDQGSSFVFGDLLGTDDRFVFALNVLPVIIFLGALIGAGREIVTLNRDPAWYSGYATAMQALDGDALNASAASVVKPEELMWLVVGDLKQIEADVRALGWGEVVVLQP